MNFEKQELSSTFDTILFGLTVVSKIEPSKRFKLDCASLVHRMIFTGDIEELV